MAARVRTGPAWSGVQVDVEVPIAAPIEQVWRVMTRHVSKWWPISFCADKARAKAFYWELQLGGRMYEDWGGGDGWLWWTIYKLDRIHHTIAATGNMGSGGLTTEVWFTLLSKGKHSVLHIKEVVSGAIDDPAALKAGQIKGWYELFGEGLKPYVERSSSPGRRRRSALSAPTGGLSGATRNPRTRKRAGVRVD